MATVKVILETKGTNVVTIHPEATIYEAAELMNEWKIGSLVVIGDGHVIGMFTERDVLHRIVAQKRDAATTTVAEVMTTEIICCQMRTTLAEARVVMKNRRIRHIPVVNEDGQLLGLISIGDLNAHEAHSQEQTIYFLQQYIYGQA